MGKMDWRLRNDLYDVIMLGSETSLPEGKEISDTSKIYHMKRWGMGRALHDAASLSQSQSQSSMLA